MITSHRLADELHFETWKNNFSSPFLSLLISKMETWQQALQTQMPTRPVMPCKWVKGCLDGKNRLGSGEDCGKLEVHSHPVGCLNSTPATCHVGRWAPLFPGLLIFQEKLEIWICTWTLTIFNVSNLIFKKHSATKPNIFGAIFGP